MFSCERFARQNGVSVTPGAIAFTVMLCDATSRASDRVKLMIAAFVAP